MVNYCSSHSTLLSQLFFSFLLGREKVSSPEADRDDAHLFSTDSPFPLLKQTEHPSSGDIVWSAHPCKLGSTLDEVYERSMEGEGGMTD